MCGIQPIDAISSAVNIVATVADVHASFVERQTAKNETNEIIHQAKVAERNAALERQEGIEEARQKKLNAILNMSEQKANIAASNLSTTSETSLNIIDDEKMNGDIEALSTMKEATRRSDNYLESAKKYYHQAAMHSFNSKMKFHKKLITSVHSIANESLKLGSNINFGGGNK